jgi:TolB-like protein/Flp pilus assembly protein TadD
MANKKSRPLNFLAELKRRKVYRASIAYVAIAFIALQIIDLLIPTTNLPPWSDELLLAIAIMGFPIAVIAAWAFELSPDGVRLTQPSASDSTAQGFGEWSILSAAAAAGLFAIAAAVWWFLVTPGQEETEIANRTIAVLPFETLGTDHASAFTEGLHLGVLTRLSNVSSLDVISRTSVMAINPIDKTLPEIADALGASWILRAEVQESGSNVQMNARLLNAREDRQVWAQNYRRTLNVDNVFDIQSELSMAIIEALHASLTPLEKARVDKNPTDNLEAYNLHALGRRELDKRDGSGMQAAIEYFEQAIVLDENYTLAWVGIADALSLLYDYRYDRRESLMSRADEAVQRALKLDPLSAAAHASLGLFLYARRDAEGSIRALTRAAELQPNYADGLSWLAWMHQVQGDSAIGLDYAKRAVVVNPLSGEAISNLTLSYLANGNYEQALAQSLHNQQVLPFWPTAKFYEALALYHQGRFADAQVALTGLSVDWTRAGAESTLALTYVATGDQSSARQVLANIEDREDYFSIALIHVALGEKELAFEAFNKVEDWGPWTALVMRHFFPEVLRSLAGDSRYQGLLNKMYRSWGLKH